MQLHNHFQCSTYFNNYEIVIAIHLFQVNHDFRRNNSDYDSMEHPRWGAIMGVFTTTHVKAGDEIFTHYGYGGKSNMPDDFPWYWELKSKIDKKEKSKKIA